MSRRTKADLERIILAVNRDSNLPEKAYTPKPDGSGWDFHPGGFVLEGAYGGWRMVRTTENGNDNVLGMGFERAGICYEAIRAFRLGMLSK